MALHWRARTARWVVTTADQREGLNTTQLTDALQRGERVWVDVRSDASDWFQVEEFWVDAGHVQHQRLLPAVAPVVAQPRPPVVLTNFADQTVHSTPRRKGRPRKYATPEEAKAASRAAQLRWRRAHPRGKRQLPSRWQPADGLPQPRSRGLTKVVEHPTLSPAPAGMACESRSWILRGLYQEQWEATLEYHQYGVEHTPRISWLKAHWSPDRWSYEGYYTGS